MSRKKEERLFDQMYYGCIRGVNGCSGLDGLDG